MKTPPEYEFKFVRLQSNNYIRRFGRRYAEIRFIVTTKLDYFAHGFRISSSLLGLQLIFTKLGGKLSC